MPPTRSHARMYLAVLTLLLSGATMPTPAAAADSPEGAVNDVLDIALTRDYPRFETAVCADKRDRAAEVLDITAQMGLDADPALLEDLVMEIRDRSFEVISDDGQTALVRVMATSSMSYPEDQVEDLVRAMLEADRGPDDPVTDEEMAFALPLMGGVLNGTFPMDEEVTVVLEDGEWRVCGGFGLDEEPLPGFEPSVSSEGLCGLVSPEEVSSVATLEYDSSSGFESFCSYSTSAFEDYHAAQVSYFGRTALADVAGIYGADQAVEVAGLPAAASGPEAFSDVLFTQIGDGILQVSIQADEPPDGFDWLTEATLISELFVPLEAELAATAAGPEPTPDPEPTPEPAPEPTPEVSLCETLPLETLNELTGLGFDDASGSVDYCNYFSLDGEPGFHSLSLTLSPLELDAYRVWMTDVTELEIEGLPAISGLSQLIIELPGGSWTLNVAAAVDPADAAATLTTDELALSVAELVLPTIDVPPPVDTFDLGTGLPEAPPELPRPMCELLELDAVNALGALEYDLVTEVSHGSCAMFSSDFSDGYSQLAAYQDIYAGIEDQRAYFPEGQDIEVAGRVAFVAGPNLWFESDYGTIALQLVLPDSAVADGLDPTATMVAIAEMIQAGLEAGA